jgi:hypothetical protein
MQRRRRSTPHTFEVRIAAEKARLEAQVAKLTLGSEKDTLLEKIGQLEKASHMNKWLSSPELRRPEYAPAVNRLVAGSDPARRVMHGQRNAVKRIVTPL